SRSIHRQIYTFLLANFFSKSVGARLLEKSSEKI
ncbi:MAG: hypothetical protein ACI8RD_005059, partial [Bacillariaceae sp.]